VLNRFVCCEQFRPGYSDGGFQCVDRRSGHLLCGLELVFARRDSNFKYLWKDSSSVLGLGSKSFSWILHLYRVDLERGRCLSGSLNPARYVLLIGDRDFGRDEQLGLLLWTWSLWGLALPGELVVDVEFEVFESGIGDLLVQDGEGQLHMPQQHECTFAQNGHFVVKWLREYVLLHIPQQHRRITSRLVNRDDLSCLLNLGFSRCFDSAALGVACIGPYR
jgi:hypothetical protein